MMLRRARNGLLALVASAVAANAQATTRAVPGQPPPPPLVQTPPQRPVPSVTNPSPANAGIKPQTVPAQPTVQPKAGQAPQAKPAPTAPAVPGPISQPTQGMKPFAITGPFDKILIPRVDPFRVVPDEAGRAPVDDRFEVAAADRNELPFTAIGQLTVRYANGLVGTGTGFMSEPGTVVTAAHVLHDPNAGAAVSVRFTSACRRGLASRAVDYSQDVDGSATRVSGQWLSSRFAVEYDYGIVNLPEADWHARCGTIALHPIDGAFVRRHQRQAASQFIVAGYPAEKANALWIGWGSLDPSPLRELNHRIDTTAGQSGAPLIAILKDPDTGRNTARAIAIHSRALIYLLTYNIARPIDRRLIDEIAGWR